MADLFFAPVVELRRSRLDVGYSLQEGLKLLPTCLLIF